MTVDIAHPTIGRKKTALNAPPRTKENTHYATSSVRTMQIAPETLKKSREIPTLVAIVHAEILGRVLTVPSALNCMTQNNLVAPVF